MVDVDSEDVPGIEANDHSRVASKKIRLTV